MFAFLSDNDRFHVCLGAVDLAHSQKCHLKLISVWRVRCKEFIRKTKDLGVLGSDGQREIAENGLKVSLSMESKM